MAGSPPVARRLSRVLLAPTQPREATREVPGGLGAAWQYIGAISGATVVCSWGAVLVAGEPTQGWPIIPPRILCSKSGSRRLEWLHHRSRS